MNAYHEQGPLLEEIKEKNINASCPLVQGASTPFRVVTGKVELMRLKLTWSFGFLLLSPPFILVTKVLSVTSTILLLVLWIFGLSASSTHQKRSRLDGYN